MKSLTPKMLNLIENEREVLSWSLINPIMHSNYGMFPHSRQMLNLNFVHFTFLSGFELTDMKFTFLIYKTSQMVSQVQRKKMRYFRIFNKNKKHSCFQINPTRLQRCNSTKVPLEKLQALTNWNKPCLDLNAILQSHARSIRVKYSWKSRFHLRSGLSFSFDSNPDSHRIWIETKLMSELQK